MIEGPGHAARCGDEQPHEPHRHGPTGYEVCGGVEDRTALAGATHRGPDNSWPASAGELAARWNAASPDRREELAHEIIDARRIAAGCLEMHHVERLRDPLEWRRDAVAAAADLAEGPAWGVWCPSDGVMYNVHPPTRENAEAQAELLLAEPALTAGAAIPVPERVGYLLSNAHAHGRQAAVESFRRLRTLRPPAGA